MTVSVVESASHSVGDGILFHLDWPQAQSTSNSYSLEFRGWVVGREAAARAIEISSGGSVLRRVALHVRPDVTKSVIEKLLKPTGTTVSGFSTAISVLGLPRRLRVEVVAVLEDDRRVALATVTAEHDSIPSDFTPTLQPMLLRSMPRSGSTWTMRLLASHPQIVTHQRYPYETRPAQYWLTVLQVLTEPWEGHPVASAANPGALSVGPPPFAHPRNDAFSWTNGPDNIALITGCAQRSIELFYRHLASLENRPDPRFFVEKFVPNNRVFELLTDLYPRTTSVFLVRDPRDTVSSVIAFNKKRGTIDFGRGDVASDEEYVAFVGQQLKGVIETWKRTPGSIMLRYEDVITRPEAVLRRLLEACGLDGSPNTLQSMVARARQDDEQLRFHRTSSSPEQSIGRWKQDLDHHLQMTCRELLNDVLRELDYEVG